MFKLFKKKEKETDSKTLQKAERAFQLLNTEAFHETLVDLEDAFWEAYFASAAQDYEARETLYVHIKALSAIKAQLETTLDRGKAAQYKLVKA